MLRNARGGCKRSHFGSSGVVEDARGKERSTSLYITVVAVLGVAPSTPAIRLNEFDPVAVAAFKHKLGAGEWVS
jgi:hypothetical protein